MRHGEAAYVADDGTVTNDPVNVPLTSRGREQAATQGQTLANIEFDGARQTGANGTVELNIGKRLALCGGLLTPP